MSKAFTSEETPDAPQVLGRPATRTARGSERPMTATGYRALVEERERLMSARPAEKDPARRAALDHRLTLVSLTLESVRVVEPGPVDGVVRFGSEVTLEWEDGKRQVLRLVGPDEAGEGRLSIDAPLARTLLEQREGEVVEVHRPRGPAMVTLVSVR